MTKTTEWKTFGVFTLQGRNEIRGVHFHAEKPAGEHDSTVIDDVFIADCQGTIAAQLGGSERPSSGTWGETTKACWFSAWRGRWRWSSRQSKLEIPRSREVGSVCTSGSHLLERLSNQKPSPGRQTQERLTKVSC